MLPTASRSLCVGLLCCFFACSPHRAASPFGPPPKCELPLAPRLDVRPTMTGSGLAVLVLDASSNAPILQAQALVLENSWANITDSAGFARLPQLPTGSYTLRVRAVGYKPVDDTLRIPPDSGRFVIIQLAKDLRCIPYPL